MYILFYINIPTYIFFYLLYLQTLHEQYQTKPYGQWHTRECFLWEYDVKIQRVSPASQYVPGASNLSIACIDPTSKSRLYTSVMDQTGRGQEIHSASTYATSTCTDTYSVSSVSHSARAASQIRGHSALRPRLYSPQSHVKSSHDLTLKSSHMRSTLQARPHTFTRHKFTISLP